MDESKFITEIVEYIADDGSWVEQTIIDLHSALIAIHHQNHMVNVNTAITYLKSMKIMFLQLLIELHLLRFPKTKAKMRNSKNF